MSINSGSRNPALFSDGRHEEQCSCNETYTASEYRRHMMPDATGKIRHNENMEKRRAGGEKATA